MTNSRIAQPLLSVLVAIVMLVSLFSFIGLTGRADSVKTGDVTVKKASDGNWYTYTNKGNQKVNYTGVAKNQYGWWRVEKGKVNFKANGVFKNDYGWWYCKDGKVQFGYTGIQKNSNGWWRIVKGKVDFSATGVFKNEYGWWRVEKGKVNFNADGVFKNEYGWWFCRGGKVDFSYTGLAKNQYGTWSIKKGKVDFDDTKKQGYNETVSNRVKEIKADWGSERHTYTFSYNYDQKTLNVTDRITYCYSQDWGSAIPIKEMAEPTDGLIEKGMLKQYPELSSDVCEGGLCNQLLLAYNSDIRSGKITKMIVKGIGSVRVEEGDYIYDNNYQDTYTFSAKNGMVKKATRHYNDDYGTYSENYNYSYNSAGLLTKVSTDYSTIKVARDAYGFPTSVRTDYVEYEEFSENYSLTYNSGKRVSKSTGHSVDSYTRNLQYDSTGRLIEAKVLTGSYAIKTDYTLKMAYNNDGFITNIKPQPVEEGDCSIEYVWY